MSRPHGRLLRPMPARAFAAAGVAWLVVRAALAVLPGYADDLDWYRRWALAAATHGLARAYDATDVDYPPGLLYPMWVAGEIWQAVAPGATVEDARRSPGLTALIKAPHVVFDLALAALLYVAVARYGLWGRDRDGPGWGRTAASLYAWNPAVLWGSAYWGQPDGAHAAFVVAALLLLGRGRTGASGAALAAGALTKPLAAPLAPLVAADAWRTRGAAGLARFAAGGLVAAAVLFLPFALAGRLGPVLAKVFTDLEAMPLTSANAHNLWWLLGPWRDANAPLVAGVTPKHVGLVLFAAVYAVLLARWLRPHRSDAGGPEAEAARRFTVAAAAYAAFFFLSTHLHENHLFLAVPLLLAVAGREASLARLAALASLAVLVNMVVHDPWLPVHLPGLLSAPSPLHDPFEGRPYTWVQVVASTANAVLVAGIAAGATRAAWRSTR